MTRAGRGRHRHRHSNGLYDAGRASLADLSQLNGKIVTSLAVLSLQNERGQSLAAGLEPEVVASQIIGPGQKMALSGRKLDFEMMLSEPSQNTNKFLKKQTSLPGAANDSNGCCRF